jgi:hypothetical protein
MSVAFQLVFDIYVEQVNPNILGTPNFPAITAPEQVEVSDLILVHNRKITPVSATTFPSSLPHTPLALHKYFFKMINFSRFLAGKGDT